MGCWIKKSLLGKETMIILVIVSFLLIYAGIGLNEKQLSQTGLFLFMANVLISATMKQ